MGKPNAVRSKVTAILGALSVAAFLLHLADAHAAEKKSKKRPAPKPPAAEVIDVLGGAPAGSRAERAAWVEQQVVRLRAHLANAPRDELAQGQLASLAIFAARDLERAVSVTDRETASALHKLIKNRLSDTRERLEMLGRQGEGEAYFALGEIAQYGIFGPRDPEVACQFFGLAWDRGDLDSAYQLSDCLAAKDPARATLLLQITAEAGHPAALERTGRLCLEGRPRDLACASVRIELAASAGRPSAKTLLGWMRTQGVGMPADPAGGLALYLDAAKAGDVSAKNNLGELYETGRGVALDSNKAFEYYREAAEAGFAAGQFNLGRVYAAGIGTPKDTAKARTWLGSAVRGGIQPAQELLDWLDAQQIEPAKP